MTMDWTTWSDVAALSAAAAIGVGMERRRQRGARVALDHARRAGDDEPPSLHPVIDPSRCVGCGSCVEACPEEGVLRVVDGRARLVNASHCVGHGRCKAACPTEAIELVFGTATRGIQVPVLGADLQSSVPGIYVAGELGGLGLIRNAVTQGVRAVEGLSAGLKPGSGNGTVDVAIVGSGPAGLAAALSCRERKLSHVVLDQDGIGGSVLHYPRRKLVMTSPVKLPLGNVMDFREVSKEQLVDFWNGLVSRASLQVRPGERVEAIERHDGLFRLRTARGEVSARRVVLATGRRGSPRKLGVPGEAEGKVAYRMIEPEQFSGQPTVVVGGGNSAVEAAVSLAEAGARPLLSYRGDAFSRVAPANRSKLDALRGTGLEVALRSNILRIEPRRVLLQTQTNQRWVGSEQLFVFIGGELPSAFLEKIGVAVTTYHGEPPRAPVGVGTAA
jgi:thioredoxin reductase/Pyruvate/2-oxoacid:ferredoxin oxidoreductase delta subunit